MAEQAVQKIATEELGKKLAMIVTPYKRHTLFRSAHYVTAQNVQRISVFESVWRFTQNIMPQIQRTIEQRLLQQYMEKETNALYRLELQDAYNQRLYNLKMAMPQGRPPKVRVPPSPSIQIGGPVFNSMDGHGLRFHTYNDIGTYTLFPKDEFRRLFPNDLFGSYMDTEYRYTRTFAIMCREDGLRLASEFSRRTLPKERKGTVDYKRLMNECAKDMQQSARMKEVIKSEEYYTAIYFDFCLDLIDIYHEVRYKDRKSQEILEAPTIFDGVVSVLVRELTRNPVKPFLLYQPTRKKIMRSLLAALKAEIAKQNLVPMTLAEIIATLRFVPIQLDFDELIPALNADCVPRRGNGEPYRGKVEYKLFLSKYHKFCDHLWRPEDMRKYAIPRFKGFNTGAMLWGQRGVGKSQILAYLGAWAHDNNWATVMVPSGSKLVQGDSVVRHSCGLYMQPDFARDIIVGIQRANEGVLAGLPVKPELYGRFNLAGHPDGDLDPVIREYDPKRKVWSDHWKTLFSAEQLRMLALGESQYDLRLTKVLPKPKTLLDIANYGARNPLYSTVCIAEILEQLYNTDDCNVMVLSDDYNEWHYHSEYKSFRHCFKKELKQSIPPHDIALVRLFLRFNGHLIRNGVKVAATTQKHFFNHLCTPDMLHFPAAYAVETAPLALNDFRNACRYYSMSMWSFKQFKEWEAEAYYTMSQGNWFHLQHSIQGTALTKC